jgi:hypothetical protein
VVGLEEVVLALGGVVRVHHLGPRRRLLDRLVEAGDRRARVADDVLLPVVEVELGGGADLLLGPVQVLDAGQADGDLLRAEALDLRLGDTELVDALPDDVDRAVDRLGRDLALRRRLTLVDELDPALQVEAEARLLRVDHDAGCEQETQHQQDHEEVAAAGGHSGTTNFCLWPSLPA